MNRFQISRTSEGSVWPHPSKFCVISIIFLCGILSGFTFSAGVAGAQPQDIDELLKRADFYFDYGWLTSPRHKNAYALYQRVLKAAPLNRHAARKILNISEYYQKRAKELEQENNTELAGMYDYRYRQIVDYLLQDVLKKQFELSSHQYSELLKSNQTDKQELIRILDTMIDVLHDMQAIYQEFPADKFKKIITQITQKIATYEQQREQYR